MAADLLKLEGLTLHYGGSQILNGIDMMARLGEVTCIMGTNGVGKTSLLKALSGTHQRSGGTYRLSGDVVGKLGAFDLARRGIGYVPQGRDIFPFLTVQENLETGFACLPRGERRVKDEIFDLFPILKEFLGRRGGDLSGGQQQQLAIARALVTEPKLLLLDEPTEGIQPNIIKDIGNVIRALRDRGDMAIVLVEQFFEFAFDLGDDFLVLERGSEKMSGRAGAIERDALLSAVSV